MHYLSFHQDIEERKKMFKMTILESTIFIPKIGVLKADGQKLLIIASKKTNTCFAGWFSSKHLLINHVLKCNRINVQLAGILPSENT